VGSEVGACVGAGVGTGTQLLWNSSCETKSHARGPVNDWWKLSTKSNVTVRPSYSLKSAI